ncbi:hypothetical protein [Jidongwangia harbinensis]|uniref:hypothetical protein n=1 Tax=Jidongwangia harbinensis TaxID=2878561 RepID=UPI001CD96ECE|nr:hypothetical protein [Jidongwangia harbinensis]
MPEELRTDVPTGWSAESAARPLSGAPARVVAAARGGCAENLEQAMGIRHPAGVGIVAAFARKGEHEADSWADLYRRWRTIAADSELDESLTFLGVTAEGGEVGDAGEDAGGQVRRVLRSIGLDCWQGVRAADGKPWFWEWDNPGDGPRLLVALGGPPAIAALDAPVWGLPGQRDLAAPPAAYQWINELLIRRLTETVTAQEEGLRRACARLDEQVTRTAQGWPVRLWSVESLEAAEATLAETTARVSELTCAAADLEETHAVAGELGRNMIRLTGSLGALADCRSPAGDRNRADLLVAQAALSLTRAQATRQRSETTLGLLRTRLTLDQSILAARQRRHTLAQTAIVAGLLAGLGALNTFRASLTVPGQARWPLALLLAGALVTAPLMVAHWLRARQPVSVRIALAVTAGAAAFTVCRLLDVAPGAWVLLPALVLAGCAAVVPLGARTPTAMAAHGR